MNRWLWQDTTMAERTSFQCWFHTKQ